MVTPVVVVILIVTVVIFITLIVTIIIFVILIVTVVIFIILTVVSVHSKHAISFQYYPNGSLGSVSSFVLFI